VASARWTPALRGDGSTGRAPGGGPLVYAAPAPVGGVRARPGNWPQDRSSSTVRQLIKKKTQQNTSTEQNQSRGRRRVAGCVREPRATGAVPARCLGASDRDHSRTKKKPHAHRSGNPKTGRPGNRNRGGRAPRLESPSTARSARCFAWRGAEGCGWAAWIPGRSKGPNIRTAEGAPGGAPGQLRDRPSAPGTVTLADSPN